MTKTKLSILLITLFTLVLTNCTKNEEETTTQEVVSTWQSSYQEQLPSFGSLWSQFWWSMVGTSKSNYQQVVWQPNNNDQPSIGQDGSIISTIGMRAIGIIAFFIILRDMLVKVRLVSVFNEM